MGFGVLGFRPIELATRRSLEFNNYVPLYRPCISIP